MEYSHLQVSEHKPIWYQNWLTCAVCLEWMNTFKTLVTKDINVKALKAFAWLLCALNYT